MGAPMPKEDLQVFLQKHASFVFEPVKKDTNWQDFYDTLNAAVVEWLNSSPLMIHWDVSRLESEWFSYFFENLEALPARAQQWIAYGLISMVNGYTTKDKEDIAEKLNLILEELQKRARKNVGKNTTTIGDILEYQLAIGTAAEEKKAAKLVGNPYINALLYWFKSFDISKDLLRLREEVQSLSAETLTAFAQEITQALNSGLLIDELKYHEFLDVLVEEEDKRRAKTKAVSA